jgi:hypothetical protein
MRRLALFVLLLPLAACQSASQRALEKSPDFKAGYADGCASSGGGTLRRDDDAYRTDKAYRSGWGSGAGACRVTSPGGGQPSLPDMGMHTDPSARPF